MKLKLIISAIIAAGIIFPMGAYAASKQINNPNSYIYQAITKYRHKNYTGCIQDMDVAISNGKGNDLVFYYKALSYSKLGLTEDAKHSYETAISMTNNITLAEYAKQAISCINDQNTCDSHLDENDITTFIKSNKFMHKDVEETIKNQAIERVKSNINVESQPSESDLKYLNYKNDSKEPTDKEIADAVRTFSKLGINPFNNVSNTALTAYNQNPEIMQINAMLNNQNKSNNPDIMNLLPMITAMQSSPNGSDINKNFVQAYMLNQMLPSFNFGNNDK